MDRVIHFGIQSQSFFFASVGIRQKIVIRKFWKNAAKIFKKNRFSYNGKKFKKVKNSAIYSHRSTYGLRNYKGQALTTGCDQSYECGNKTERLDMTTMTWSNAEDFPFKT